MNKDNFSMKIKQEILGEKNNQKVDIISELYGIFISKNIDINSKIVFNTELEFLANRVIENLEKLKDINFNFSITNKYSIIIENADKLFSNELKDKYVLRGIFLATAYIKDPEKAYSIYFFLNTNLARNILLEILKKNGILEVEHSDSNLVCIRKKELILDFLVYLGTINSFFEFQDIIINKEIKLKINRNMNYELANETKKIKNSLDQIKMINKIDEIIGLRSLSASLREVAILRLENEEASLQELADMIKITKSGIRNRFRRLKEIYEESIK